MGGKPDSILWNGGAGKRAGRPRGRRYNVLSMALLGARYVVALEPSSVAGAAVSRGLGSPRIRSFARAPLPPGALSVSPFEDNVTRPDEVAAALQRVASDLGAAGARVCVVLPDGVARMALLDVPADAAADRYARFKLAGGLSYPAEEALVEVLAVGRARVVAAAVRRAVVEGYERVVQQAGLRQDRVDLAPLAATAALALDEGDGAAAVDVILGESAVSLVARLDGSLRAFRNRRRDPGEGEPERLYLEALRTAIVAGDGARPPRVRVLGPGAPGLVRRWREEGADADLGWRVAAPENAPDAAELAWLGAALS